MRSKGKRWVMRRLGRPWRCLVRDGKGRHGTAAVEFAIIVPVLVLLFVGTVDMGIGLHRKMQVENAAQAGAAYAIINGFAPSAIASAVTSATNFSAISATPSPAQFCGCPSPTGIATIGCNSSCTSGSAAGTYVTVSAQATYNTILPYHLFPSSYLLTAQSTVRIQ